MRLRLNLASQPYENARAFYLRWGLLLLLVLLATAALLAAALRGWTQGRDVAQRIAADRREIARLQDVATKARAVLAQPENKDVALQAAYLNELIARKAFSWTQVFADLEKIMPPEVRVLAIQPALDADNQLEVRMTIEGTSHDRAVQFLRHLEDSPRFREAQSRAETFTQPGGAIQFQISALYLPQPAAPTPAGGRP